MNRGSSNFFSPTLVTVAISGENPSICSFSLLNNDSGINNGKYTFCTPFALNSLSKCF